MDKKYVKNGISLSRSLRHMVSPACTLVGLLLLLKMALNIWTSGVMYLSLYPNDTYTTIIYMVGCWLIGYIASWLNDLADLHEARKRFLVDDSPSELMLAEEAALREAEEAKKAEKETK